MPKRKTKFSEQNSKDEAKETVNKQGQETGEESMLTPEEKLELLRFKKTPRLTRSSRNEDRNSQMMIESKNSTPTPSKRSESKKTEQEEEAKSSELSVKQEKSKQAFTKQKSPKKVASKPKKPKTPEKVEKSEKTKKVSKANGKSKKDKKASNSDDEEESSEEEVFQDITDINLEPTAEEEQRLLEKSANLPEFAKEENVRDSNLRRPGDPDYDPSTLHIPQDQWEKLSPMFKQYWGTKAKYFDKLVALKFAQMHWFFYQDAFILKRILDVNVRVYPFMTMAEISHKKIEEAIPKILAAGYSIVFMDQLEPSKTNNSKEIIKREVTRIYTRATYAAESSFYNPNYLMTYWEMNSKIGICLVETVAGVILLAEFDDDRHSSILRTILARYCPTEIVYTKKYTTPERLNLMKNFSNNPTLSGINMKEVLLVGEIVENLSKFFEKKENYPELLKELISAHFSKNFNSYEIGQIDDYGLNNDKAKPFFCTFQALNLALVYLQHIRLDTNVVPFSEFSKLDYLKQENSHLQLDAQALKTLEIFDVEYALANQEAPTFFSYINHTVSPFGKRMLRNWLMFPSMKLLAINDRLDAVEELMDRKSFSKEFQNGLKNISDLESRVAKIYAMNSPQKLLVYMSVDHHATKIHDFVKLLNDFKKAKELLVLLQEFAGASKSGLIQSLPTYIFRKTATKTEKFLSERLEKALNDLLGVITFDDDLPVPTKLGKEFGILEARISEIQKLKNKLNQHLDAIKKDLIGGRDVKFVHGRKRYEIEIPEGSFAKNKKPPGFVQTSKRKGFIRFQDGETQELAAKLMEKEYNYKLELCKFLAYLYKKFCSYHQTWHEVIQVLSIMDCLISLSKVSLSMEVRTRPMFIASSTPRFELRDMTHPILAQKKKNFTRNDIVLDQDTQIMLITGPNMGGKSTVLRQACIAIVLAQIGCFVPARSLSMTLFDRIFTRLGACDKILEKKSTYFVEMEETLTILNEGSDFSFAIIDELGRGTSTFDGMSIAYAVLKFLSERSRMLVMFTTHYHLLVDCFYMSRKIKPYYVTFKFENEGERIMFEYKLKSGRASSFGIEAAKIAGLPQEIIHVAQLRRVEFDQEKAGPLSNFVINAKFESSLVSLQQALE